MVEPSDTRVGEETQLPRPAAPAPSAVHALPDLAAMRIVDGLDSGSQVVGSGGALKADNSGRGAFGGSGSPQNATNAVQPVDGPSVASSSTSETRFEGGGTPQSAMAARPAGSRPQPPPFKRPVLPPTLAGGAPLPATGPPIMPPVPAKTGSMPPMPRGPPMPSPSSSTLKNRGKKPMSLSSLGSGAPMANAFQNFSRYVLV